MTISAHLETFAGLIVVDCEPGQTHRRGEPGVCTYRLSAFEFEKEENRLPKLIDLYLAEPNADQTTAMVIGPWNYEDMIELHAGIDLLLTPSYRHAVLEVNAFGDLLPGVLCDGRDTYETELVALAESAA